MSTASVPVLYAGTTRLYPKPYVSRPENATKDQKSGHKASAAFADLDRLLATSTANLQQKALPSYRWDHNATSSPAGTPQSVLIAQQSLVAIYFANRLQLFNTATSTRNFEYVFESETGKEKWAVTDVVECTMDAQSTQLEEAISPHTIVVSVMTGASESRVYLIDYLSARTLMHVTLPFVVTKLLPAWSPTGLDPVAEDIVLSGGLFSKFENPLVLGSRGGALYVLDLWFNHSLLEDDSATAHPSAELKHSLTNYDPKTWRQAQQIQSTHPYIDATAAVIGPSSKNPDVFYYLNPMPGEFIGSIDHAEPVPKESAVISALHLLWPAPSSQESRIRDQIGSMDSLDQGYAMDIAEEAIPGSSRKNGGNSSQNGHSERNLGNFGSSGSHDFLQSSVELNDETFNADDSAFAGRDFDFENMASNWIPGLTTPLVIVGYNFGTFQIWALDTMELLYCSPIRESRVAVTGFETQSLHSFTTSPHENKVLLWVARGSLSTTWAQQAHAPHISAYGITLLKSDSHTDDIDAVVSKSDCLESVVLECATKLPSSIDGEYYGSVHTLKALPCWESKTLNNSSLVFAFETFPAHPKPYQFASSRPSAPSSQSKLGAQASQKSSNFDSSSIVPLSTFQCHILSTSSLRTDSDSLFTHPDQLLQLTLPYDLDTLNQDPSHLLAFNLVPSSIQHYFPHITSGGSAYSAGAGHIGGVGNAAHVSFDAIAIKEDSIWQIGFSSFGQQLLNALAEQGPIVFDRPELIEHLLNQLDRSLPTTEEEAHTLREDLFSLALHNNLSRVITDYVMDSSAVGALANLKLQSTSSAPLHQVLGWARANYERVIDTVRALTSEYLLHPSTAFTSAFEKEETTLELRQAKRLLNDLYNIVKALIVRYQTQRTKWDAQEEAMQKDLTEISLSTQFIELCVWFMQNSVHIDFAHFSKLIESRRQRVADCAAKSPLAWDVAYDSKSKQVLGPSGSETTRLTVTARKENTDRNLLLIDHLVASINVGSSAENAFQFPPQNVSVLLDSARSGDPMFIAQKHQALYYLLLDTDIRLATSFAERVLLTEAETKLVRGVHAIDAADFEGAMHYITDTAVTAILTDELALKTVKTLLDARAFPNALALYRVRQPPLDTLESSVLALYVLLGNGLMAEAFFHVRNQARTTLDSYDATYLHTLLFHFLHHAFNNGVLKDVFQLPFDAVESEGLKQYLLWSHAKHTTDQAQSRHSHGSGRDSSAAVDLHLVFLLQRSRVADAVSWYHQHNNDASGPKDRDNELMKTHLVNNWIKTLPQVIRTSLKPASLPQGSQHSHRDVSAIDHEDIVARVSSPASKPSSASTPSKRIVTKLFASPQPSKSAASSRFAPAALGPALLSPTNPGRFAKSPALFRPTIVLGSPAHTNATKASLTKASKEAPKASQMDLDSSSAPRPSLFSDRDITANLIGTPAKRRFAGVNVGSSSVSESTATNPIPEPVPAPTIVSKDSLITVIDDDDDLVVMETPVAPISTPTKKVADSVKLQSDEARRQSILMHNAAMDDYNNWSDDGLDTIQTDLGLDDESENDEDEEEEEDGEAESYDEMNTDDEEELELIRGQTDDELPEQDDVEESNASDAISRSSRRSAASARSKLSQVSRSSRSAAARPADRNLSRQSTAEISGRQPRRTTMRGRNIAQRNPLDTVDEERSMNVDDEEGSQMSEDSRRSSRRRASNRPSLAAHGHEDDETSQDGSQPRRSTRIRRTSSSSAHAPPAHAVEGAALASIEEEEALHDETPHVSQQSIQRPKRTSRVNSRRTSDVTMAVDSDVTDGETHQQSSQASAATDLPAALPSRRSSRISKTVSEPMGVHPASYQQNNNNDSENAEDMSGDTVRIRRSSRTKASEKQTSTAHIASRTRSLRLKDRR